MFAAALVKFDSAIDCNGSDHNIELGFVAACDAHDVKFAAKYWNRLYPTAGPGCCRPACETGSRKIN